MDTMGTNSSMPNEDKDAMGDDEKIKSPTEEGDEVSTGIPTTIPGGEDDDEVAEEGEGSSTSVM